MNLECPPTGSHRCHELLPSCHRRSAATESLAIGYGGDAVVSSATGLARETIRKGRDEIVRGVAPAERLRRPGAGRPRIQTTQPGITAALEALVDPLTRGDPTSPAAVDVQESREARGGADAARVACEFDDRGPPPPEAGLQPAGRAEAA